MIFKKISLRVTLYLRVIVMKIVSKYGNDLALFKFIGVSSSIS